MSAPTISGRHLRGRRRRAKKNLAARTCSNNDELPVCPPSMVLCRECMDMIGEKLRKLLAEMENRPASDEC